MAVAIFGSSATEPGSSEWADAEKAGRRCVGSGRLLAQQETQGIDS